MFLCGELGHIKRHCPHRRRESSPEKGKVAMKESQAHGESPEMAVEMGGITV